MNISKLILSYDSYILQSILDKCSKKKTLKSIELHKFFCINVTSNALDVVHFCRFTVRKCCKMSWAKNCIKFISVLKATFFLQDDKNFISQNIITSQVTSFIKEKAIFLYSKVLSPSTVLLCMYKTVPNHSNLQFKAIKHIRRRFDFRFF